MHITWKFVTTGNCESVTAALMHTTAKFYYFYTEMLCAGVAAVSAKLRPLLLNIICKILQFFCHFVNSAHNSNSARTQNRRILTSLVYRTNGNNSSHLHQRQTKQPILPLDWTLWTVTKSVFIYSQVTCFHHHTSGEHGSISRLGRT